MDEPEMSPRAPAGEPSVVEIPLRRRDGTVHAVAVVDEVDAPLAAERWCLSAYGYVSRRVGGRKGGVTLWLQREIIGLERGDPLVVDHIDGDPLNNRRANLRVVTRGQNQQNRRGADRGSTSRHRGVSWSADRKKWVAAAKVDGKQRMLGRFDSEEEAARAASAFRRERMPFSRN